jgi:hypothetical protein
MPVIGAILFEFTLRELRTRSADRADRQLTALRWLHPAEGEDWRAKIRQAITHDALAFIACFSSHTAARQKSHQNEELLLAVEQLRSRRPDDPWLVPVRFDNCDIPKLDLGAGRTLGSLQRADLFGANRDQAAERLVTAVQRLLQQPVSSVVGSVGAASAPDVSVAGRRRWSPHLWRSRTTCWPAPASRSAPRVGRPKKS